LSPKGFSIGFKIWMSLGAAILSTLVAAALCSVSFPVFLFLKSLFLKGIVPDTFAAPIVGFLLIGIFAGYFCVFYATIPNFLGLAAMLLFWSGRYPAKGSRRFYICGSAYGLFIFLTSLTVMIIHETLRSADPYARLAKSFTDMARAQWPLILLPAAVFSGIFALNLLGVMIESAAQKLQSAEQNAPVGADQNRTVVPKGDSSAEQN
jgi:hypothetical protein